MSVGNLRRVFEDVRRSSLISGDTKHSMKPTTKPIYFIGCLLALAAMLFLLAPAQAQLRMIGPANTGHSALGCVDCHESADGTPRQQIQANLRHLLGLRETAVDFQHEDVTSQDCLACHARPNDNHPIFRFNEPRFAEARAAIGANDCISCHLEHQGQRVTIEPTYCINCHQDLTLKNDPLDIPHDALVETNQWESCLGCHDFHGNHLRDVPTTFDARLPEAKILDYFAGGESPYAAEKITPAQKTR